MSDQRLFEQIKAFLQQQELEYEDLAENYIKVVLPTRTADANLLISIEGNVILLLIPIITGLEGPKEALLSFYEFLLNENMSPHQSIFFGVVENNTIIARAEVEIDPDLEVILEKVQNKMQIFSQFFEKNYIEIIDVIENLGLRLN